jgi:hypothetical protein
MDVVTPFKPTLLTKIRSTVAIRKRERPGVRGHRPRLVIVLALFSGAVSVDWPLHRASCDAKCAFFPWDSYVKRRDGCGSPWRIDRGLPISAKRSLRADQRTWFGRGGSPDNGASAGAHSGARA